MSGRYGYNDRPKRRVDEGDQSRINVPPRMQERPTSDVRTIRAGKMVAATEKLEIDLDSALLTVRDAQDPVVDRVRLGRLGTGVGDYGLEIYDATGGLIFGATGAIVTAANISVGTLSEITDDAGIIVAGKLQGAAVTLDLNATGTSAILSGTNLTIRANGAMTLGSQVTISAAGNATFSGSLSAATGTFAGNLSAAGGTFSGSLSAATGTFAGNLSAAGGTFSGSLSAATGTFAGTVTAGTIAASVLIASSKLTASSVRMLGAVRINGTGTDDTDETFQFLATGLFGAARMILKDYSNRTGGTIQGTFETLALWSDGGGVLIGVDGDKVGFYDATPVALQTGVAVTAAGIHAALVNLGLITA